MSDTEQTVPLPTAEEIETELKSLRIQEGLTDSRIDDCPKLSHLPAVNSEMQRHGVQRRIATISVLECAVDRFSANPQDRQIIRLTLNLQRLVIPTLKERRELLRNRFYLSENAYDEREKRAYRRLARWLVQQEETTCGTPLPDELYLHEDRPVQVVLHIDPVDLREMITAVVYEATVQLRESTARTVLNALPRLESYLTDRSIDVDPIVDYEDRGRSTLQFVTRMALEHMQSSRALTARQRVFDLSGAGLPSPIDVSGQMLEDGHASGRLPWLRAHLVIPTLNFEVVLIGVLAEALVDYENQDLWSEVLQPPGTEVSSLTTPR